MEGFGFGDFTRAVSSVGSADSWNSWVADPITKATNDAGRAMGLVDPIREPTQEELDTLQATEEKKRLDEKNAKYISFTDYSQPQLGKLCRSTTEDYSTKIGVHSAYAGDVSYCKSLCDKDENCNCFEVTKPTDDYKYDCTTYRFTNSPVNLPDDPVVINYSASYVPNANVLAFKKASKNVLAGYKNPAINKMCRDKAGKSKVLKNIRYTGDLNTCKTECDNDKSCSCFDVSIPDAKNNVDCYLHYIPNDQIPTALPSSDKFIAYVATGKPVIDPSKIPEEPAVDLSKMPEKPIVDNKPSASVVVQSTNNNTTYLLMGLIFLVVIAAAVFGIMSYKDKPSNKPSQPNSPNQPSTPSTQPSTTKST